MNNEILASDLKSRIKEFLKDHKSGYLATCMNNIPRSSPVQYFLGQDMEVYIVSSGGEKFKAIKENPNVCLVVTTEFLNYKKIKGVQIFGKATTCLEDPELYVEANNYNEDFFLLGNEKNHLKVIKVIPEEIVYLDAIANNDRVKQILKNDEVITKKEEQQLEEELVIH